MFDNVSDGTVTLGVGKDALKLTIPLGALDTGEYACQITVLDPQDQKAAFWQTPVRIVP